MEAQRQAVANYLNGGNWRIVGEFVEIESGRRSDRPELDKALVAARVRQLPLVVAKVDRLTRSVAFLSRLLEAGVDVRFADLPAIEGATGKFLLQQMAAVAELEAGMISARTKAALAAAKRRGKKLGGDRGARLTVKARAAGRAVLMARAQERASDLAATIKELQELGYSEGKNLIFEIREARGDVDRLPELAFEIVNSHPDVIVAVTSPAAEAARMATQTIPIVMAIVPDPVGLGFVESLARPGTNITGSSSLAIETIPKRVQLIKEILPELSRLGMLWNAKSASNRSMFQSAEQAARSLGVPLRSFPVQGPEDLQPILKKVFEEDVSALLVAGDLLLFDRRADVIAFSLASRIPTFHTWPEEAVDGAVAAYGAEIADQYRQAAVYVAKILAGAAPADLPVDQAMRFQFVLNMKTANAIGLKIPDVILLRADKVIE
jgi:ABC-type uncharacterized transport system substrate-binding protein